MYFPHVYFSDSPYRLLCKICSLQLKNWACVALFSNLCQPPPPPVSFVFKGFRKGHLLNTQLSLVPGVPQILSTPQNIAIDQGTNSKVVPTSYDRLGHPYCRWSHSPQIYSICFSPNLSIQAAGYNHTHLDIQRRPILWGARLSWLDLSNKGYGPTSPIMKRCLYW